MAAPPLLPAFPRVAPFRSIGLRAVGVFLTHYGENGEPRMARNSSPAFVKRPQLCLISGVRPPRTHGAVWTPQGLKGEDSAVARRPQNLSQHLPPSPAIKSPSLLPSSRNPTQVLLPQPFWPPAQGLGGRGERSRLRESSAQIPRDLPAAAATASYVFPFDKSPLLQQK